MTRFLLDAQLPPGLATRLTARGYLAEHVNRVRLGAAGDEAIWRHAQRVRATLVTKDEDFAARLPLKSASAVLWIRIGNCSNHVLIQKLRPLLPEIVKRLQEGEKLIEVI